MIAQTVVHNNVKCIDRHSEVHKDPNGDGRLSAKEVFDEARVCKTVKELFKHNKKKADKLHQKVDKDLNEDFIKEDYTKDGI